MATLPEPAYAELHCLSSFSFGRGASSPEELVQRAHALGYAALALTDECSVAGVVRAHVRAQELGLALLPGAEFALPWRAMQAACTLVVLPHDLQGWGQLCELITAARRSAPKGRYQTDWDDPHWAALNACEVLLVLPHAMDFEAAYAVCMRCKGWFGVRFWLALELLLGPHDAVQQHRLRRLSEHCGVPLVAAGQVLCHVRSRKPLQDVLSAVRLGQPLVQCAAQLQANAEAHLRDRVRLAQLYPPEALAHSLEVAQRCHFSLDALRHQYPRETLLPGCTPAQTLRHWVDEGALRRYPAGMPPGVVQQVGHELALIAELRYEMYFLTVHDIVRFARSQGILCQGRGSAANSAVCYCLGITEVDPARSNLLFERFISRERNEPPDIDVDFEHDRREEVIQYIYAKYGRERAALTAVVISYRPRSALRDVGRALEIPAELIGALAREHPGMYSREVLAERLQAALARLGPQCVRPSARQLQLWLSLSTALQGLPRHLSQHVGGFVLAQGRLTSLVPVENAAMPERSIIQWDKDDLDALGLLKVDVLALGMLSAIRRCCELVGLRRGHPFRLQDIVAEDPATYDMVCRADTVGVFQIESRAQMSMLPRLKPRCFYDLVVQVAIVRPGPIQGGMVHPYLKARAHPQAVQYPSEALKGALQRTLGVPIFQEQVMQIAMLAAGFSAGESDALRRSMAAWKRKGGVHKFYERMVSGMLERGHTLEFAQRIFKQIEGFGEYGFPESHAASFALLAYVSAWFKCHEPACFLAALINSQPMGFYGPAQLVQDAQRHGVQVRAVDVTRSDWDCTLEEGSPNSSNHSAVRLGLRLVSGLAQATAQRIVQARAQAAFASTQDLALRCGLDAADLKALAGADALCSLSGHRRQQVWDASALHRAPPVLQGAAVQEDAYHLEAATEGEDVLLDYATLGLTLRSHPLLLLREQLSKMKQLRQVRTAAQWRALPDGTCAVACGLVSARQQPQTAKGVVFVTLEDETGMVQVIVYPALKDRARSTLLHARLMAVYGQWQRDAQSDGAVCHLIARRLYDLTPLLGDLVTHSRDFC